MKKKLLATALVAISLFTLAGCDKNSNGTDGKTEKVVTIREIYDANKALGDKTSNGEEIDFTITMNAAAKSSDVLALLQQTGEDISMKSTMVVKATKDVQNIQGTVDVTLGETTEAQDLNMWYGDGKSYAYNEAIEAWTSSSDSTFGNVFEEAENADTTEVDKFIEELQTGVDDKDNTDMNLELKGDKYVLTCNYALSKLADIKELEQYTSSLGLTADSFKSLQGKILITATFDAESLIISSLEIKLDDTAKNDVKTLMSAYLSIEIGEVYFKAEVSVVENSTLAIPEDVKANAIDMSSGFSDILGNDPE